MKHLITASLFLFGSEVLSLVALLAMAVLFCVDILRARMEVSE